MTVGKDAAARPQKDPKRRRPRWQSFAFGIGAGAVLTVLGQALMVRDPVEEELAELEGVVPVGEDEVEEEEESHAFVGAEPPPINTVTGAIEPRQFLATMLVGAGLGGGEADRAVRALSAVFDPTKSRPGDTYRVDVFEDGTLARFEYQAAADRIFVVARDLDGQLAASQIPVTLESELVLVEGEIEHSLWVAFERSGESPVLAATLAEAFQFDIDFFHDTRKGDRFRFYVEKLSHRGQVVRYGHIPAAEYVGVAGGPVGTKRLYRHVGRDGKAAFYDENGKAAQRAFLRSPLEYTRVSSGFGSRHHPILKRQQFHGGVDYAAPVGTPVRAVADGVVSFAGLSGPSGNMVRLRHPGGYESFYLHLSKILVKNGARVSQSTLVGKVGTTGRSTGPHLCFRLKKDGKYLNPQKNVAPRTLAVSAAEKGEFLAAIAPWRARFEELASTLGRAAP